MIVAFANNQVITADASSGASTITTDPVPMNENNNAAAIPVIHYIYGGTSRSLEYKAQLSNDGVAWVDSTLSDILTATGAGALQDAECRAAFIRFQFTFTVTGSGQGAVCFDLHARLDRQ